MNALRDVNLEQINKVVYPFESRIFIPSRFRLFEGENETPNYLGWNPHFSILKTGF